MYNTKGTNFKSSAIRQQKIYIAKKLDSIEDEYGNPIPTYAEPVPYIFNVMPLSESTDIIAFGEQSNRMKISVINYNQYKNKFNDFDVAYLDNATPENEIKYGDNANYQLVVRNQNDIIKIYFKSITKGE